MISKFRLVLIVFCFFVSTSLLFKAPIVNAEDVVIIKDTNLKATIRENLGLGVWDEITLSDMQRLRSLYSKYGIGTFSDLSGLEYAVNLEEIHFVNEPIRDFTPLGKLPALRKLDFFLPMDSTAQNLSFLSTLGNVEELVISSTNKYDLTPIQNLTKLKVLNIEARPINETDNGVTVQADVRNLSFLKELTSLENLNLTGYQIDDLSNLSNLLHLSKLNLGSNYITNISPLQSLTNLQELNLETNRVFDISTLTSLKNLKVLNLGKNSITDISSLENLTNLQSISLWKNQITSIKPLIANFNKRPALTSAASIGTDITIVNNHLNVRSQDWQDIELLGRLISQKANGNAVYYNPYPQSIILETPVREGDTVISGRSGTHNPYNIKVYKEVKNANDQLLGTAFPDENGNFAVTISAQRAGTTLILQDSEEGVSHGLVNLQTTVVVQPSPVEINESIESPVVTLIDLYKGYYGDRVTVKGTAEPRSTIEVKQGEQRVADRVTDALGNYSVSFDNPKDGEIYQVTASKKSAYFDDTITSKPVSFRFTTNQPKIHSVLDTDQEITGTAEPGTRVEVKMGGDIQKGTVNSEGSFSLPIGVQKAGTAISLNFTGMDGIMIGAAQITVEDRTAPKVTGVTYNQVSNRDLVIKFNEGTATLNDEVFISGSKVTKEGKYTLFVTDEAGNETTVVFTIDKTAPKVTGVTSNQVSNRDLVIHFNEGSALLNGKPFKSGTSVKAAGVYTIVVTDTAGNKQTVKFRVDKTAPMVSGVLNNAYYNKDVKVSFNEGTATLKGKPFKSGTLVKAAGVYTIVVTDVAGNKRTVKFTIDKTVPARPIVNKVSSSSKYVSGKTEAYATIKVKAGSKNLGTAKADKYGKYKVTIKLQKKKTRLTIVSYDLAGNQSKTVNVSVK